MIDWLRPDVQHDADRCHSVVQETAWIRAGSDVLWGRAGIYRPTHHSAAAYSKSRVRKRNPEVVCTAKAEIHTDSLGRCAA
jgi:hypothetical protein